MELIGNSGSTARKEVSSMQPRFPLLGGENPVLVGRPGLDAKLLLL